MYSLYANGTYMENKLVPMGENTYRISLENIKLDCYKENSLKSLKEKLSLCSNPMKFFYKTHRYISLN